MKLQEAQRLQDVREYYFAQKLQEIADLEAQGHRVINLGIGSPDLPPHPSVIAALHLSAQNLQNHAYQPYRGILPLRIAMADWMRRIYGVSLEASQEILPLIGSKEGIFHIAMAFLNPQDKVLVPNPAYPAYATVSRMTGAQVCFYQLDEARDWRIDFDSLESHNLQEVKICWVNFPNMPTGADANDEDWKRLIALARKYEFLIVNDNPYSLILNDLPKSILQIADAKEVAIELNSLSKSHHLAGWRVGWLAGKADYLTSVLKVKSNMDSGMFKAIQEAAITALALSDDWFEFINTQYQNRKQIAERIMQGLGCQYAKNQKGMFIWAKIPKNQVNAFQFTDDLLREKMLFLTPGSIFGSAGDRFVRLSLCSTEAVLQDALSRLA